MSLALRAPHPPVPWRPEQNDRKLALVVRDLLWSSTRLFPYGNGIVLNDPPLVYDLLLHWHTQGNCLCIQTAQNQFGAMALVAPVELQVPMGCRGTAACGCDTGTLIPTLPLFQCVLCQFTAECFVQQAASPSFAWRQSFDCSIHPSAPSFLVPIVNPDGPGGGWMAAMASSPHSLTELCHSARAVLPIHRKPTVHAGCIRHKPRQQIMVCWGHDRIWPDRILPKPLLAKKHQHLANCFFVTAGQTAFGQKWCFDVLPCLVKCKGTPSLSRGPALPRTALPRDRPPPGPPPGFHSSPSSKRAHLRVRPSKTPKIQREDLPEREER